MSQATTDVAVKTPYTDDVLRSINSYADLIAFAKSEQLTPENFSDYGNGVRVITDKALLVGREFVILSFAFHTGDNGPFVSALCVTRNPVTIDNEDTSKVVINDGSTGIMRQLETVAAIRRAEDRSEFSPIIVRGGLRVSKYDYEDEKGEVKQATTYYLA